MRTLLLSVILLFCGSAVFAQWYPKPHGPLGMEVGYSYAIGTADFTYQARDFDESTGTLRDTGFTKHLTSSVGFGGFLGYSFPVARLGAKSRLAISATYMYNAYIWEGGFVTYSVNGQTIELDDFSPTYGTVEMALPVGADYKWGSDAIRSKTERTCFSLGAGLYPSMDMTNYLGLGKFAFHMRPYLRAEAGFFAGLCFKLRATYIPGKLDYVSYGFDNPGSFEETKLTSKGSTVLSLVIMPMSWKFSKGW